MKSNRSAPTNPRRDTIQLNPITLLALIGAVVAFILSSAFIAVLWVGFGAAIGALVGWVVQRLGRDAATFAEAVDLTEHATLDELQREASEMEVPGRSSMTKAELAKAIAEHRAVL